MAPIKDIASKLGIDDCLIIHDDNTAKIPCTLINSLPDKKGKLILVTGITPTKQGVGKTTTTISLSHALDFLGKKSIILLKEHSCREGEDTADKAIDYKICQQLVDDARAISSACALLGGAIDAHIAQGNSLKIEKIWKRPANNAEGTENMPECSLVSNTGSDEELVDILSLSRSFAELKARLGEIIIGWNSQGDVHVKDLKAEDELAAILAGNVNPILTKTSGCPVFAGIWSCGDASLGNCSILSVLLALKLADYAVAETDFSAELGIEKFCNISCRLADIKPDCVVIVATVNALKEHGDGDLKKGLLNLESQSKIIEGFDLPYVVALNSFETDTLGEIHEIFSFCEERAIRAEQHTGYRDAVHGGVDLAMAILREIDNVDNNFHFTYTTDSGLKSKIESVAKLYGAQAVQYTEAAE